MNMDRHYSTTLAAQDQSSRHVYAIYSVYRLLMAVILFALHSSGLVAQTLGRAQPSLYLAVSAGYLAFAIAIPALLQARLLEQRNEVFLLTLVVDVVALVLMNQTSGGLSSGLGFLLLITVAAGSILLPAQLALFLAALATLGVLIGSAASVNLAGMNEETLFLAGLLGILLFTTAGALCWISRGLRATQKEADIRRRQTHQLQRLNELIIDRMHTGIIVIDDVDRVQLINGAAISLLGGSHTGSAPLQGDTLPASSPLGQRLQQWRVQPRERPAPFSPYPSAGHRLQANFARLHRSEGDQVLIFVEDTRSLAETAQQLKLASLGHLTGSIAHEIRNPLGAISHAAQLLLEDEGESSGQQRLAGIIKRQSDRMNSVIENVLSLSRRRAPRLRRLHLNSWLEQFCRDYRDTLPFEASLELELYTPEPDVIFDSAQLEQVVGNLLENALRYSHEHSGVHRARLCTGLDRATRLPYLDIIDYGPGLAPADCSRVFEPFFTTSNGGTGLGLYIGKELCEVNYATLTCNPSPGGACFRIGFAHPDRLLPRMDAVSE